MVVGPCVEVKPIESYALLTYGNFGEARTNGLVEAVSIHPQISGCIPQSNQAWQYFGRNNLQVGHGLCDPIANVKSWACDIFSGFREWQTKISHPILGPARGKLWFVRTQA
jgi:hypothetical protein